MKVRKQDDDKAWLESMLNGIKEIASGQVDYSFGGGMFPNPAGEDIRVFVLFMSAPMLAELVHQCPQMKAFFEKKTVN